MNLNVAALTALDASPALRSPAPPASGAGAPAAGFAQFVERSLGEVDANAAAAQTALGDLAAGRPVELHEVMIAMEKARISVETFVQIRNKLVESYQDLMRMQM